MIPSYVYAAIRTPFGKFNGTLADVRPDDLAAQVITSILARVPHLDPSAIGEVVWGNANGAGEDNRNVGRMAALLAGLPVSVPATTVNRLCGSSLDAVLVGSRTIETGDADIVLTGGVESMTRAPWVLPKPKVPFPAGDVTAVSTTLGWRLVNPAMPKGWTISLGEANEQLQERYGISRDRQDAFAARSHERAHHAWEEGFYDDLVVGVEASTWSATRESARALPRQSGRAQARLPQKRHHHRRQLLTLSDGASAVLLGSAAAADRIGTAPLARVAGRGAYALEPQAFGYAPVEAANAALNRAGVDWLQVGAVELNEAFAVSRSPASTRGPSTLKSSRPAAARSLWATRWVLPAAGSSALSPKCSGNATSVGASPPFALASDRAWPSCSRTRQHHEPDGDSRDS